MLHVESSYNVVALAKTVRCIPTVLTTVPDERGGLLLQQLQDVFPDQKPINRTVINAWGTSASSPLPAARS